MTEFWTRLARNRLLDVAALALAAVAVVRIAAMIPERARANDFAHYYLSSRLLLDGANPYTTPLENYSARYGFEHEPDLPTATNPPPLVWLFALLAWLPPDAAFAVWVVVEAISLAAILWLTGRLLGTQLGGRGWFFVCAGAVAFSAVYWNFYFSHVELLLAAMVLAAFAWRRAGHDLAAGLVILVAGLLKFYPFVLLPWFVWRGRGPGVTRLGRAVVLLAAAAMVVVMIGRRSWCDFVHHALPVVGSWAVNHSFNYSVPSLVANLGYAVHGFAPPLPVAHFWGAGMGLVLLGLVYWWCLVNGTGDGEAEFCLVCVAMLVCGVTAWGYYLVFLIYPLAVAVARVSARPTTGRVVWLIVVLGLLNVMATFSGGWLDRHLVVKVLVNNLPLFGMLALGGFFVKELPAERQ